MEDDTNEDFIDPWGIINKPLKVVNQRSHWVSEALFGKYVSIGNKINNEIYLLNPKYDIKKLKELFKIKLT